MIPPDSSPPPPTEDVRKKAAAYLRAHGLPAPAAEQLAATLLESAAAKTTDISGVLDRVDVWAAGLVSEPEGGSAGQRRARGRVKAFLAGAGKRWPGSFLSDRLPAELTRALEIASLHPIPGLHQTAMTPQPLDLGPVSEVANGTWRTFDKWPVLRGLTIWFLFVILLAVVFYTVRF